MTRSFSAKVLREPITRRKTEARSPTLFRGPRFASALRVSVRAVGRVWWTRVRDLGARGLFFYADNPPTVGTAVEVTLRVDAERHLVLHGRVRFRVADIGADVELDSFPEYSEWLERRTIHQSGTREVSGWVRGSGEEIDMRFDRYELVMLGADRTPVSILFTKYPPKPVWRLLPECHGRLRLSCLSPELVGVRLSAADEVIWAWLGITLAGDFVGVIPPAAGLGPRLVRLSASTQLVVTQRGKAVFPFFDARDLERIEECHIGVRPSEPPICATEPDAASMLAELGFLADWVPFDERVAWALDSLFTSEVAKTRTYRVSDGPSSRLLLNLGLEVRGPGGRATSGLLFHDGVRACVLLAQPDTDVVIRPLEESDHVRLSPRAPIVVDEANTFE
ncbi:MAG: PilZ domain-containing protein [Deltaproteobacteria bacterium]|nr:PilZ domain-containing protein [Deltaproteobacteria bacterium]